jgi:HAE1 family hydrophobic/amphiphilic exporter-1
VDYGTNLSIIAALGAVLLIGIVVKNAIVLVDYINLMRDRGLELYEAHCYIRQVKIASGINDCTHYWFGNVTFSLKQGEGSEIWTPMGISVIGGLIFYTFLTLIVIPVGYAIFERRGQEKEKVSTSEKLRI